MLALAAHATTHVIQVWDGYYQYLPNELTVQLGDTIQWLPLDDPMMVHTITSTSIPEGAAEFDYIWQSPTNLFFQYVPTLPGVYDYHCIPHAETFNMVGSFTVEGVLSIENETEIGIAVFPNPSTNSIRIQGDFNNSNYSIFNMNGALVGKGNIKNAIDISTLNPGIYVIQVLADRPRNIRFVKE